MHINNISKKANATLGFLRRNLRNVPETCRKTAYISRVRSTMEYGATIWNPYLKGDIDKLERIQNRGIRFIKKDYRSRGPGSITNMIRQLELETLEERQHSLRLILLYIFLHVSGTFLRFLLRKPKVAFAFLLMLFMCMLHLRSFDICRPRYGTGLS
jgi:hypothetical protein